MQLQPATPPSPPTDLADGLEACARERGQRPAVTVLGDAGRAEQGFVTLAQWAAKGAHLLQMDLQAEPGSRVLVDIPPGWTLAAACAAVWWVGGTVVIGEAADVDGAIVHEARPRPDAPEVYVVGDAVDGGLSGGGTGLVSGGGAGLVSGVEAGLVWSEEVQAFPDQPPPRAAEPDLPAIDVRGTVATHADLVAALADDKGVLGIDLATFAGDGVREVAARPLVTGRATVVLRDGLDRSAADGDRVTDWA